MVGKNACDAWLMAECGRGASVAAQLIQTPLLHHHSVDDGPNRSGTAAYLNGLRSFV